MKIPRDLRSTAKKAREQGWKIRETSGGHLAWKPPAGRTVFCPSTPSDSHSVANVLGKLRRAGLQDRPPS